MPVDNRKAKEFLLFGSSLPVTPTLLFCLFFIHLAWKEKKQGRQKLQSFLTVITTQAKIFLLFCIRLSFTRSLLCSIFLSRIHPVWRKNKQTNREHLSYSLFWPYLERKQKYFCFYVTVFLSLTQCRVFSHKLPTQRQ